MISREQKLEMLNKMRLILPLIEQFSSIKEISEKTNIPTSRIQRYLNNEGLIRAVLTITKSEESYEELSLKIKEWLKRSKTEGHKRGGVNSQNLHSFSKDEEGKFLGSGNTRR